MKEANKTKPSQRSMTYFVNEKNQIIIIEITKTDISVIVIPCKCIGLTSPVTPKMPKTLKTFEPKTLPIAIALLPFLLLQRL